MTEMHPMLPPAEVDRRPRLLIIGCSTRAAAWSAVRAGFRPVCADQFGDLDLHQVAEVVPYLDCPQLLPESLQILPVAAWMSLGIDHQGWALRQILDRAGQAPKALSRFEYPSPERVQQAARSAGLIPLKILKCHTSAPLADGNWLLKPWLGGGGIGIRVWDKNASQHEPEGAVIEYFQERAFGRDCSALFLLDRGEVRLLGATEQLIGDPQAGSHEPFAYGGNIGPIPLPPDVQSSLVSMVKKYRRPTHHRGLFGVDFIWGDRGVQPVEINHRYTASTEILELALDRSFLGDHWSAFRDTAPPAPEPIHRTSNRRRPSPILGKLILYARQCVAAPDLTRFLRPRSPWMVPFLADIPRIGTRFETGQPLCTVYAGGGSVESVRSKLYRRAKRVRSWFEKAMSE